ASARALDGPRAREPVRSRRGRQDLVLAAGCRRGERYSPGAVIGRLRALLPSVCTLALLSALVVAMGPVPQNRDALIWQPAGGLAVPRAYGIAVALLSGDILVVGGLDRTDPQVVNVTSELFVPATKKAQVLSQKILGRVNHTATVGWGGRVVVVGGSVWAGDHWDVTNRVDVFIP